MPEMKLSPLRDRERPQEGMFHHLCMRSKLRCAGVHNSVHFTDFRDNLGQHLLRSGASGTRHCGRLNSIREISKLDDNHRSYSLLQGRTLAGASRCEHSGKSLGCSGIRQVQMFENLDRRPLPCRVPPQFLRSEGNGEQLDLVMQSLEMRVHGRY